jgi:hypothetical protein
VEVQKAIIQEQAEDRAAAQAIAEPVLAQEHQDKVMQAGTEILDHQTFQLVVVVVPDHLVVMQ